MNKLKKVVSLLLVMALTAAVAVGTTVAFLTDDEEAVNQMTMGNVDITLNEKELSDAGLFVDFTQDKPLYPAYVPDNGEMENTAKDTNGLYTHEQIVDKIVSVTNTGTSDAFVRVAFAFELGNYDEAKLFDVIKYTTKDTSEWKWETVPGIAPIEVDGKTTNFVVVTATYVGNNGVLAPKATTPDSLLQVWMDGSATNETCKALDGNGNGKYDILVKAQAMQTEGFDAYLDTASTLSLRTTPVIDPDVVFEAVTKALNEAFNEIKLVAAGNTTVYHPWMEAEDKITVVTGSFSAEKGEDIYLAEDTAIEATTTMPYGNKVGVIQNGGVFDGNNKTLSVEADGDGYAIMTYGGTIKNVTINEGFRGIVLYSPTEDVIIDNVKVCGKVGYAINTAEHPTVDGIDLIVSNSTFGGWSSFAGIETASFTACEFVEGEYYNSWPYDSLVKPYVTTTFAYTEFAEGYYLDLSALGEGCTVTFDHCEVNGEALTAELCGTKCDGTEAFCVELPTGRTLADCVIFK